ncbi:MAG: T9SS type A sorting domain-containing protein [Chitinophagales bacterium]
MRHIQKPKFFNEMKQLKLPPVIYIFFILFYLSTLLDASPSMSNLSFDNYYMPDSTYDDSTIVESYLFGDTVQIVNEGFDTLYILYEDTLASNDSIPDSTTIELKEPISQEITITLGNTVKEINQGLFGINVSSMFDHVPEENAYYLQAWQQLSDLKPKSIRFPDGSGGKFMHLLGSENADGSWNGGYGFNLDEIIPFYDMTYLGIQHPDYVAEDVETLTEDQLDDWIAGQDIADFEGFREHYFDQVTYDPTDYGSKEEEPLFINQFLRLIKQIEEDNEYTVEVILCLDILCEPADKWKEIINYLRSNTIHNVNVVGVEVGNEVGLGFFDRALGITDFGHYWEYIKGNDIPDFTESLVLTDYMLTHHNYLQVLKGDPAFEIKVGLPADNLHGSAYAFRIGDDPGPRAGDQWNIDLRNKYNAGISIGGGLSRFAFDAVIIHPYYKPTNASTGNTNYKEIPLCLSTSYSDGLWNFTGYDSRLSCAYDGIVGVGNVTGNFKKFMSTRYKQAWDAHNVNLGFDLTSSIKKELWTTEWNFHDNDGNVEASEKERVSIYANSFVHAELLQEWMLKNIKLNFQTGYRENFFTYATLQNFVGGTNIALLNPSNEQDQVSLGLLMDCSGPGWNNYFVPRTTYYEMLLLSDITANNLDYISSSTGMFLTNLNLPPTVFIDPEKENLYVYYTNVKKVEQNYIINSGSLLSLYPGAFGLGLEDVTIHSIDADQLYSTSGKNSLFDLNTGYNSCGSYPNRFEITYINIDGTNEPDCSGTVPPGGICVTVEPTSVGYIKIPIHVLYPPAKTGESFNDFYTIYPNPAYDAFTFKLKYQYTLQNPYFYIEVFNVTGKLCLQTTIEEGQSVNISELPAGVYTVSIKGENLEPISEPLIKIK